MENLSIGSRIKQKRKELNLTQMQIKQATGISSGNLSEIENGNKLPSTPALISLSAILNCSIDWILKGETPKRENLYLTDNDSLLLNYFHNMAPEDQDELLMIAEMKFTKEKKRLDAKSSAS